MAQEGSKRPSEGPKEPQEAPTVQMRLNPWTLPSARGLDVAICPPYPKIGFWLLRGRLRPTHSLSRLPRALISTHTQTHSNSDSLTLRLTHTQFHSHSDPPTHRPLRLIHTLTQTHLQSCSLTPRPQRYSHSDSLTLTCTHRAHYNSYSSSPFGGCLRRCACVCPFPRTSLRSEQVARV